jgi:hypothetical protein
VTNIASVKSILNGIFDWSISVGSLRISFKDALNTYFLGDIIIGKCAEVNIDFGGRAEAVRI